MELRCLADYDTALGLDAGADSFSGLGAIFWARTDEEPSTAKTNGWPRVSPCVNPRVQPVVVLVLASTVDAVGMRMGTNSGRALPLLPTI